MGKIRSDKRSQAQLVYLQLRDSIIRFAGGPIEEPISEPVEAGKQFSVTVEELQRINFEQPDVNVRPPTPKFEVPSCSSEQEERLQSTDIEESAKTDQEDRLPYVLKPIEVPLSKVDHTKIPKNDPRRAFYESLNRNRSPWALKPIDVPLVKIDYKEIPKNDPRRAFYKHFT